MPRYITTDYRRKGRIDNMVKDLNGAQDLARRTNMSMPLTTLCLEVHPMLTITGIGKENLATLMEYFKDPNKQIFKRLRDTLFFKSTIETGKSEAFRAAVLSQLVPRWKKNSPQTLTWSSPLVTTATLSRQSFHSSIQLLKKIKPRSPQLCKHLSVLNQS